MQWRKLVWAAAVGAAAMGCGQIPANNASELAKQRFGTSPQPGTLPDPSTGWGRFPLGPSTAVVGTIRLAEQPKPFISLDGTVPADQVHPSPEPLLRARAQPRMAGEVAYIPGVPDRRGHGITARNGVNLETAGGAMVTVSNFTDPTALTGSAAAMKRPPQGPPQGVGGAGGAAQQGSGGEVQQRGRESEGQRQAPGPQQQDGQGRPRRGGAPATPSP